MTENTNESPSKLLRLEMIFIFHTEEEMEQEEEEDGVWSKVVGKRDRYNSEL